MDPDIYLPVIPPVLALLATNAYFVTAEYALLTLQRGHVEGLSRDGERRVRITVPRPEEVLLLTQLGRSVSTLGLGYGLARLGLTPVLTRDQAEPLMLLVTLVLGALVHAVISAQIPKLLGIHYPRGRIADLVVAPVQLMAGVFRFALYPLSRLVGGIGRWVGITGPTFQPFLHTPDEIRSLVVQGHEQGVVEEDEREMIHGVFEFSETVAREVMTPRIAIVAVPVDTTLQNALDLIIGEGHSRLPVYEDTIDTVVGVLLAKDLLPLLALPGGEPAPAFDVRNVMRKAYFVPDTKPVDDILAELRQQSVHLAIVLDEFGGTYGLLTMEDLLEEIVGEINDEYDIAKPDFFATPEGDVLIEGGVSLSEVNERFGLALPEDDFDTLGGYIFGMLGRVPAPGDEVESAGLGEGVVLHVDETEDRRVTLVRMMRPSALREPAGGA